MQSPELKDQQKYADFTGATKIDFTCSGTFASEVRKLKHMAACRPRRLSPTWYPFAAAWLVAKWLRLAVLLAAVASFTAGLTLAC